MGSGVLMSNKSERDALKSIGAKVHKNSGRNFTKGDGSDSTFIWDVKEASRSFSLTVPVWNKICTDAYKVDPYKNPGLFVILDNSKELAIIEMSVLQQLMEYQRMYEELMRLQ
jgi:hypothetical protein